MYDYKPKLWSMFGSLIHARFVFPGSDIFSGGGGGSKGPQLLEPPWQTELRKTLGTAAEPGALERINRAGETYPGQLTAGLSGFEQTGLGKLGDFLKTDDFSQDPLFQAGREELLKTFGGEYDPEGPYYQAYKTKVMQELTEAQDRLKATTSARDKFFGGGRIAVSGELEESAVGDLALILGQLFERERERKLQAVPEATRTAIAGDLAPQARIEAYDFLLVVSGMN